MPRGEICDIDTDEDSSFMGIEKEGGGRGKVD
jgi:hypothetical protein